jgi:SAM-dependent methyltransferase
MAEEIIGLDDWLQTPPGRRLLHWEQAHLAQAVTDLFGYNALQLGIPELDALEANRMPHRWLALTHALTPTDDPVRFPFQGRSTGLVCDPAAMPFPADSLDLLVLPHALELSADPHAALREAERVLRPEGRVVITGLNPLSLWALRQRQARVCERLGLQRLAASALYLPQAGEFIGYWRLRDWLRLLAFEQESVQFGVYQPAVRTERWLQRFDWMDGVGSRWWPILGAVYMVVAVKRVKGMRWLGPAWKPFRATTQGAPASVVGRQMRAQAQSPAPPTSHS